MKGECNAKKLKVTQISTIGKLKIKSAFVHWGWGKSARVLFIMIHPASRISIKLFTGVEEVDGE